ncbi:MAG: winged helix-turn-helix transcriptional regulator [Planctomycetaceae bacterium]|nr:winged helix-turn-helix transcriptional regulator [Planctomycetaceae bacterium]MCA9066251.1 winged helix-turn-helix transcriptional regulator [Planctomycetaceae bacterium]
MAPFDSKDREILEFLHRCNGADIQDLCGLLGVTRNAIRQRISRLEAGGLLSVDQHSQGRGRPRNVYRVTAEGLHSLGEDYRELAVVLWESMVAVEDPYLRNELMAQVRNRLADRFRRRLTVDGSVESRLDELADEMKSSGFNVESDHSSALPILRETNCPFPMLADIDESICQIERQVLEQVLGAPVSFRNRCRDGHNCCEFEVQLTGDGCASSD